MLEVTEEICKEVEEGLPDELDEANVCSAIDETAEGVLSDCEGETHVEEVNEVESEAKSVTLEIGDCTFRTPPDTTLLEVNEEPVSPKGTALLVLDTDALALLLILPVVPR